METKEEGELISEFPVVRQYQHPQIRNTDYVERNGERIEVTELKFILSGLVVRVPGYRSIGPRFHSRPYQIF
jgi:hypothetical protein